MGINRSISYIVVLITEMQININVVKLKEVGRNNIITLLFWFLIVATS
jgi:hypothetical protein